MGAQPLLCQSLRLLGAIYQSKGEIEKAVHNFEAAPGIASSFDWHGELFEIHAVLALLFLDEERFDDTYVHAVRAKSLQPGFCDNATGFDLAQARQGRRGEVRGSARRRIFPEAWIFVGHGEM